MTYKEEAIKLHKKGCNCAQSVVLAFKDHIDIDEETLYKITEAYGVGMGCQEGTCGAISGALLIASYLNSGGIGSKTKAKTYQVAKEIVNGFKEETGTIICKELKKPNSKSYTSCDKCIAMACDLLENKLGL